MKLFYLKSKLIAFILCLVSLANAQVTPSFTVSQTEICQGIVIGFENTSTNLQTVSSCLWDFGNNTSSTLCSNVGVEYTNPGTYDVCLRMIDNMNDTTSICTTITVNPNPSIGFTVSERSGCTPLVVQLQDTTNTSQASWGWTWVISSDSTFCDPAVIDTISKFDATPFNYTIQNAGNYHVKLSIENALNCYAEVTKIDYIIVGSPPIADFSDTVQTDCDSTTNTIFANASQSCSGNMAYLWDFGDNLGNSALGNPTYEYQNFGDFDVTLIATDPITSCSDTTIKTILIPKNDTAYFAINKANACKDESISFFDLSSGNVTSWAWDFGDGSPISTLQNPTHLYDSIGTFQPSLIVTIDSCTYSYIYPSHIEIHADPVINYQAFDLFNCSIPTNPDPSFTANPPFGITWQWDFGDGSTTNNSRFQNHEYTSFGVFPVSLTGTDQYGCQTTIVTDTVVIEPLSVLFTADTLSGCHPKTIQFTDTSFSQSPLISWEWILIDDQSNKTYTSTGSSASITFDTIGVFDAYFIAENALGCRDTLIKPDYITIGRLPDIDFTTVDTIVCISNTIDFINLSKDSLNATNWNWQFGDGQTIQNQFEPSYQYSTLGTFDVTLSASIYGCTNSITKPQYIKVEPPIADFEFEVDCADQLTVIFTDSSTNGATYHWDFGDSTTSTDQNPVHQYARKGVYSVVLQTFHPNGCMDQRTRIVNINTIVNFGQVASTLTDGCYQTGVNIVMTDSSENVASYEWIIPHADFISQTTNTDALPIITFDTTGIFDITLAIIDNNECPDTLTKSICISGIEIDINTSSEDTIPPNLPIVVTSEGDTIFNYVTGCTPFTVNFMDSTTAFPDTTTLTYLWRFGDGDTSTLKNPTHIYTEPINNGVFVISVTVRSSTGMEETDTLGVFARPTKPLTHFSVSKDSVCIGEPIAFINQSTGVDLEYQWDFGNNITTTKNDTILAFDTAGVYTVCLYAVDINGCDSIFCDTISVLEPTAGFTTDTTYSDCDTLAVTFTNTSINATSFFWNFGTSGSSNDVNSTVSYSYGDPGDYTVCLTATNSIGCSNVKCDSNLINIDGPQLKSTDVSPLATCIPADIELTAIGENIAKYTWIPLAGDTTRNTNTSSNITDSDTNIIQYTYITVDTFHPQLIVEDAFGCQRHFNLDSVITTDPKAIFTLDTLDGCVPLVVVANANESKFAVSYQWQAPGSSGILNGNSATPSIIYNTEGYYDSVRLIITDFTGCQDTTYFSDTITASKAFAHFAMDTTTGCTPLTVNFTDTSSAFADTVVDYQWNFGDLTTTDDTSSLKNSTYIYNYAPSNHVPNTVQLIVTSEKGCVSTITQTVLPTFPVVNFDLDTFVCTEQFVNFTDLSNGINLSYHWDFGDSTITTDTSILQNPTYRYNAEGIYKVCLTATDVNGCQETHCDTVQVAYPIPNFSANKLFVACPPDTVQFTDESQYAVAWEWDFGDNSGRSFQQHPIHVYTNPGIYTIMLIVTSVSGCKDTLTKPQYIEVSGPYAEFSYTPVDSCSNMDVLITADTLYNTSLIFYQSKDQGNILFFNNINSSNSFFCNYNYKDRGTYLPVIQLQDTLGCARNIPGPTLRVTDPEPNFTLQQNSLCNPLTVTTTNNSVDAVSYEWIAPNGTILPSNSAVAPTISYTDAGTYTVRLAVTDRHGCSDTLSQTVIVADVMPAAVASTNLGCRALTVQFTDNSTSHPDTITNWLWDFGNGATSTEKSPAYVYTQNGIFTVTLTVTNTQNCSRTITVDQITVTFPTIAYSPSRTYVCTDQVIDFTNLSSGENITYDWDFGDGNDTTIANPSHSYANEGTYQACLTVTDENNCDTMICKTITVANPKPGFTVDKTYTTCYDSTFYFTDTSQNVVSWSWDFGDGTATSTQQNPVHIYTTTGIYTVCLTVTSASGCVEVLCKNQLINVDGPTGSFAFSPKSECAPVDVEMIAIGNSVVTYEWLTKENNTIITHHDSSGTDTLNYTYTTAGLFYPQVNLIDSTGCTLLLSLDSLEVDTLQFDFSVNALADCADSTLTFSHLINSSSPIDSIRWDFPDGSITTSTIDNPIVSYNNVGTYDVSLTVYSRHCSKTVIKNDFITIHPNPVAAFDPTPQNSCNPVYSSMNNTTTILNDSITSWSWDFGETNTSADSSPFHNYNNCGDFDILLTATSSFGCIDTAQRIIDIRCSPVSLFSSETFACTGQNITFNDQSMGNGLTFAWDFGDGNTSTLQNPTHNFANENTYQVCLTVTDLNGCDSLYCNNVLIANPVAAFIADTIFKPCPPDSISFTDQSDNAVAWNWSFGDGQNSDQQNPVHTFDTSGFYTICLTVTSASGCTDQICKDQFIEIGGAKGDFVFTPKSGCGDLTVRFEATGEANNSRGFRYIWDFGNGNSQTHISNFAIDTFEYIYTTAGEFYPSLRIEDSLGCGINVMHDSVLVDTLQIDFYASDSLFCDTGQPTFTPYFYTNTTVDSVRWTFSGADITTSTLNSPTPIYSTVGEFDVTLTVFTRFCTKTITKQNYIKIVDSPIVHFGYNPTLICDPNMAYFSDSSSVMNDSLVAWSWNFADGSLLDTVQNPAHLYQSEGLYQVALTVTSNYGCATTTTIPVQIEATPTSFFASNTFACTDQNITFNDQSIGNGLTFAWDFGDGNTSTLQSPIHNYANEGTYQVCLTVADLNGCDSTYCNNILIANPVAAFIADTIFKPCPPDSISFTDQSANAVAWNWSFGDGQNSDQQNPIHTFDTSGFYTICLTVTSASGCTDQICKDQFIEIGGAKGDFVFTPKSGCGDLTVRFEATGEANNSRGFRYIWDFGNGDSQTHTSNFAIDTFEYTYTTSGEFFPSLRIEDSLGCGINVMHDSILVDTLQIDFYASDSLFCDTGQPTFTPYFYTNTTVDSVRWDFSGANITTSTLNSPMPIYSTVGEFDVTLTVFTRFCTKTITKQNYIKIVDSPIAHFGYNPTLICDPNMAYFTDSSSVMNDSLVAWSWDFADGSPLDTTKNPAHLYQLEGLYQVALTVTSNYGCATTTIIPVEIDSTPISFFSSNTFACTNQNITFNDQSIGNGLTFSWNFGDGNASTLQSPIHNYANEGTYQVCLTVADLNGCDSTYCNNVLIADPVAAFISDTTFLPCPPDSVFFTDQSINAVAWNWDFGDGQNSNMQNPVHTFDTSGFYTICLTVTSASGCTDVICKNQLIEVSGAKGTFTTTPLAGCTPHPVFYEANGYNAHRYIWDFGDGVTRINTTDQPLDSFTYVYDTAGIYIPTLRIEDTLGCGMTYIGDPIIVDTLMINFIASDTFLCGNGLITFTPNIAPGFPIDSIEWNFFGAQTNLNTNLNPVVNFQSAGSYDVELKIYSGHCFYSIRKDNYINIAPKPMAVFDAQTNPHCSGQAVDFTNLTVFNNSLVTQWAWDFGDNDSANVQQPLGHIYQTAGTYNASLIASTDLGCIDTMIQTITVFETPIADVIANLDTICIMDDIQLNGSGIGTYQWSNANTLDCSTCSNPVANPSVSTQYVLSVTAGNGCIDRDSVSIYVRPYARPSLTLTNDTTICKGDFIQLFAQTNANLTQVHWNSDSLGLSCYNNCINPFATPEVATTYIVTVDGQGVCDAIDSVNIQVIDPNANILGNDVAICSGDSIVLQTLTGTDPVWSPTDGLSCTYCPNPTASPTQTTDYIVTVTVGNCVIIDTIRVEVVDLSQFSAGADQVICENEAITLPAVSPVNGIYQWSPSGSLDNSTILNPSATPDTATTYILTMNFDNCVVSDTIEVSIDPKTNLEIVSEVEICEGEEALIDVFGNADQVTWSPTDGILQSDPIIVSPTVTTTYTVIGTRNVCLPDTALVTVTVHPLPELEVFNFLSTFANRSTPLTIFDPNPTYNYEWSPDIGITCTACITPRVSVDTTQMYYVNAITEFGCMTSDSILVSVRDSTLGCAENLIDMPNTFTPNNDGNNDIFYVRGNGIQAIASFRVFNRWGELVFETSEITEGWDGTYEGNPVLSDVYLYHIVGICPVTGETVSKKGDILVVF